YDRYYRPSNALFVLYGNIPTEDYLEFLEPRLKGLERRARDVVFERQARWQKPRTTRVTYPESPARAGSAYLLLTWLAGDGTNPRDALGLYLLHCLLLGHEGAPLRKAILDAKIGEDLALSGADAHSLEAKFSIGVKGSKPERAESFVSLVESTLNALARRGFERAAIESAGQQLAYSTLEIGSSFPIELLFRVSSRYVLTGDFVDALRPAEHLASVLKQALDEPTFLTGLIRERLLENPHRLLLVAEGDADYAKKRDDALAETLRQKRVALTPAELQKLTSDAEAFELLENEAPDRSAFDKLPFLKTADLPSKPRQITRRVESEGRLDFIRSDVFANGVNYLHLDFDLSHVPAEKLPQVALYLDLMDMLGTARRDYVQTGELIAAHTGGIGGWLEVNAHGTDPERLVRQAHLTTKFLDGHAEQALGLFEELLFELNGGNVERIADALTQARARQRSRLASLSPRLVSSLGGRGVSPEAWLSDQLHGVPKLRRTEELAKGFESRDPRIVDALTAELKGTAELLRRTPRLSASFTGSENEAKLTKARLQQWTSQAPAAEQTSVSWQPRTSIERVGLAAPMDVAFCAFVLPGLHLTDPQAVALRVGAQHLSLHWVLDEIRLKGSAYGGWCQPNLFQRDLELGSYRDPNPARTLELFESAAVALG
ncbi:MAG TPA: insulinase family protein, partial [Polyangiaceae bacterium]|nr:insulinase family protein [Polyangiaceae bacterium]